MPITPEIACRQRVPGSTGIREFFHFAACTVNLSFPWPKSSMAFVHLGRPVVTPGVSTPDDRSIQQRQTWLTVCRATINRLAPGHATYRAARQRCSRPTRALSVNRRRTDRLTMPDICVCHRVGKEEPSKRQRQVDEADQHRHLDPRPGAKHESCRDRFLGQAVDGAELVFQRAGSERRDGRPAALQKPRLDGR